MRLEAGTEAPDFEVETVAGERVQLNELRGKPVWLGFSRWASCPMCNYRIHQMIGEWPRRYEKREFRHLNFSPSPPEKLQAYVLKQSPPFDLVSDVEQAQQRIVDIVRRLEESGDLVIEGRGGEGETLV